MLACAAGNRELWRNSWLAVLRCTPLSELAQERAAVAEVGWQLIAYEAAISNSSLFQLFQELSCFMAAGPALQVAAAVSGGAERTV